MGGRLPGEASDDDAPAVGPGSTDPVADEAPSPARPRFWLRRLGTLVVVALVAVAIGLQVQVGSVRREARARAVAQERAGLDEQAARIRLESVDARELIAQAEEDDAQAVLDRSLAAMTAQGLEESTLPSVKDQTRQLEGVLRTQSEALAAVIAEQERIQPLAGACLFDLLRQLGRGLDHQRPPATEACSAIDGLSAGPG